MRRGKRGFAAEATLRNAEGWIEKQNDLTLAQMLERLQRELVVNLKRHALWYQLNRLGLTYKKRCTPPSRKRLDVKARGKAEGKPAVAVGPKAGVYR